MNPEQGHAQCADLMLSLTTVPSVALLQIHSPLLSPLSSHVQRRCKLVLQVRHCTARATEEETWQ